MPIHLYTGLPGAGKSYQVVEHVIAPALKAQRIIYTNLPLKLDVISERFGQDANDLSLRVMALPDADDAASWGAIAPGALIVIDEAWNYWPSGVQSSKLPAHHKEFFSMHRHRTDEAGRSQQIVVITQDPTDLAAYVRNRIEQHYQAEKLTAVGQAKRYRVDVYRKASTMPKDRIRELYGSYKPEVYDLYQSHTQGEASGDPDNEAAIDTRGNLLKSRFFVWGLPVAVVLLIGSVYTAYSSLASMGEPEPVANTPVAAPSGAAVGVSPIRTTNVLPVQSVTPAKPAQPGLSATWRLAAVLEKTGGLQRWFMAVSRSGYRRIPANDCQRRESQWWCLVDGDYVTEFTGPATSNAFGRAQQDRVGEIYRPPGA